MSVAPVRFQARQSVGQVEEGNDLAPKFDDRGLITVVTTDADSGELLMQGYMNAEALGLTLRVHVTGGASCHVGYRSCFYRRVPVGESFDAQQSDGHIDLEWTDREKVFDPQEVYGDAPNPTKL
jgi:phosphoribosyl-AMP cyclohydrolase